MTLNVLLHIDGRWVESASGESIDIVDPATGMSIGQVQCAGHADLDQALEATASGWASWRAVSVLDRGKVLKKAASLLRDRAANIAPVLTGEHGKPLHEATAEVMSAADIIDWFAEECRRTYGRIIPARALGVMQAVMKEPVGPVAAFSPWNFPISQAARKVAPALAAGCSIILKGPEETPASCAELMRAFADAGLPPGAMQLVFGVPADISRYLIPHPVIRKISFTGSTAVGKQLAALAGQHMKRTTMELGGHAPVLVFDDANVDVAIGHLTGGKFRNAGQICASPTRFLVQAKIHDVFVERFSAIAASTKVGNGRDAGTQMGPLAHARRIAAMEAFVADAVAHGAQVQCGGRRIGNQGYFFEPTVLTGVSTQATIMNEEPFGPIAVIASFDEADEAIAEANRLGYGLAAFAYTRSLTTARKVGAQVEAGMVSINHNGLALPEVPFGGIKDSGHGLEGGAEGIEPYLATKFITEASA
jgi:succinate-semialdehyde dehydrogenase/glutarate-semialdehyde dehydrogenase